MPELINMALFPLLCLLIASPAAAQVPVSSVPDWASYGTAAANPVAAAAQAWRAPDRGCRFGQLALAEGIGNAAALTLKHFVVSPRPCVGCAPDGFPSGHTTNSFVGVTRDWRYGVLFGVATGGLRMAAHRHTLPQVLAGAAVGIGADAASRLLRCAS